MAKGRMTGMDSPMGKAYTAAQKDGPIEDTLEYTADQAKQLIKFADKVILDAADKAGQVPANILKAANAIKTGGVAAITGLGKVSATAGSGLAGAIKALVSSGGFPAGTLMGPAPKKKMSAEQAQAIKDSRADNVKPKMPLPKPRPERGPGRPMPPTLPPSL